MEYDEIDLPPVVVRGGSRPPAKLIPLDKGGPRGTPPIDSPDSTASRRPLLKPISTRPHSSGDDTQDDRRLLDEMFGDSTEPDSPKVVKRRKKKKRDVYIDLHR